MSRPLVVAVTGASGAIYALRLLEVLAATDRQVHLTISPSAALVLRSELGVRLDLNDVDPAVLTAPFNTHFPESRADTGLAATRELADVENAGKKNTSSKNSGCIIYHKHDDFFAPIASGSFLTDGMVICPCSGGTLSAVAAGGGSNLIHRAADVHLKERRLLVLAPRETPLSLVHLDNMRRAAELGAVVLPASPGWYHGVHGLRDLVDFIVARILDQLHVPHRLIQPWGETPADNTTTS